MSKFAIIKGDLLKMAHLGEFTHIAHGCNCFNVMGAGIAGQIAKHYPRASKVDKLTKLGDMWKLGNFTKSEPKQPSFESVILNFYTQFTPGADFFPHALSLCLEKFIYSTRSEERSQIHLGVPWIGCGIGGGNKEDVERIFRFYSKYIQITVVELP